MNWKVISRNVGYALLVSALFMFLSVCVSLLNGHDSALAALSISFLITFIVGLFPFVFVRKVRDITLNEGYVTITLAWLFSFIFGMLPYALWGSQFNIQNAWFESVSGFTTTGATILSDIEALPKSLLFWRSSTHFIGGLGITVFLLMVVPSSSPINMRLTTLELSPLSKSGYASRPSATVKMFAYIYLGICGSAIITYSLAGMPVFDAICHGMSVCAAGGFSTRNLSIAAFGSPMIEFLTMVFMLVASLHFGVIFLAIVNRSFRPLNNPVIKFYVSMLALASLFLGLKLRITGFADTIGQGLWEGTFQVLSYASTTGFGLADNAEWPLSLNFPVLLMGTMCGCSGSCTGGLKSDRVLVLFKSIGVQVSKSLHPSLVNEVKLAGRSKSAAEVNPILVYVGLFLMLLIVSCILTLASGVPAEGALPASLASITNVGPSIGEYGTMGNYNNLPAFAKAVLSLDMFLGRVEIYPLVAVVTMLFDRRDR